MLQNPKDHDHENPDNNALCDPQRRNPESWIMYVIGFFIGWVGCWVWYFGW